MDETGCFWRGLPEKTLDAKERRCTGGKKAKQRLTWAFFVNAEGEKEDPVVIGTSFSLRCFKNLQSPSGPYNCSYFANCKAWMNTEIMATILSKLNRQLKGNDRHILLFMDNAPCHPQTLSGQFLNISVQFLPKNTTSQHRQIKATRCRYNLQLEGPLQKTNAALRLFSSWRWEKRVRNRQIHQRSYGYWMGDTSLERCSPKHYHEVLSEDWFVSTWWTNRGRPLWRRGTCQPEDTSIDDDYDKELEEPSIKSLAHNWPTPALCPV